jgi:hypothetical protein
MIEVTFKFDSIEKAIATLGSLMKGAAPVPNIENPAKPEGGTVDKKRKPRADAGKARGPYKDNGVVPTAAPSLSSVADQGAIPEGTPTAENTTPPETAAPSGAAVSGPIGESNSGPTVQTAAAATQEQAQAALEALFAAKGLPAAQAAMGQFGVSRLRDMKPEDYGPFVAAAQEATK